MLLPSLLRTVVPLLAGWILVALTHLGFSLNSDTAQAGVTLAVAGAYYVVFRLVERTVEKIGGPAWLKGMAGVLLGWGTPPRYRSTDSIVELLRESRP
ncbi:hypothetical protein ACFXKY_14815 [Streptomyces canus]|uniref:hypothetical protein n=1 Tax=Streptomyces canus TaxID=58343 RepID=UPI00368E6DCC